LKIKQKKYDLVFITDSLGMGGNERSLVNLLKLLDQVNEKEILLIVIAENDTRVYSDQFKVPKHIKKHFIYRENYNPIIKVFLLPLTLHRINRLLHMENINTIFSLQDHSNLINVLLKRIKGHKVVTSERKFSLHYFGKHNIYMKYFIGFVFNNSDIIIVNDIEIKESLIKNYKIQSDITVLNNILIEENRVYAEQKRKNKITFITIGRLSDEKNTKDILIAFSKIVKTNYFLKIIGDGPNRESLKKLAIDLKISNNVEFFGQVNNVFNYLSKSDIFVFSSLNEGFPNVILEAMSVGLPIVSYKFKTGINSILDGGRYGVLVKINDVENLGIQMNRLAEDHNLREQYSKLSLNRIKKYKNAQKYIKNFLKIVSLP